MHHSNKTNSHLEKQSGNLLPCTIQTKQIHIRKRSLDIFCHSPVKQNKCKSSLNTTLSATNHKQHVSTTKHHLRPQHIFTLRNTLQYNECYGGDVVSFCLVVTSPRNQSQYSDIWRCVTNSLSLATTNHYRNHSNITTVNKLFHYHDYIWLNHGEPVKCDCLTQSHSIDGCIYNICINTHNLHMRHKSVLATGKYLIVLELFKRTFCLIPIKTSRRCIGYTLPNGKGTKGTENHFKPEVRKIQGATSPCILNFSRYPLMFWGPQYGTRSMSPFWPPGILRFIFNVWKQYIYIPLLKILF